MVPIPSSLPPSTQDRADIAQFMLISSLLMLLGLIVPTRGDFVFLLFTITNVTNPTVPVAFLLILPIGGMGVISSIVAFLQRHRLWGGIALLSGLYVLVVGDRCGRMYGWIEPVQLGGYALFAGTTFLIAASFAYIIRPGVRPVRLTFFSTTIQWQQLRTTALLCYIGAVVAYHEQFYSFGGCLFLAGIGCAITAFLMRFYLIRS
jgi:hypothetical protein